MSDEVVEEGGFCVSCQRTVETLFFYRPPTGGPKLKLCASCYRAEMNAMVTILDELLDPTDIKSGSVGISFIE